jgi:uncharacterized membrane protein YhaH (DUF805 family)
MSTWYYYDNNGHKQGPITGGQLKELAKAGKISPGTMVETEEGKAAPARKVKGLTFVEAAQPQTSPPHSPTAPNPFATAPSIAADPFADTPFVANVAANPPIAYAPPERKRSWDYDEDDSEGFGFFDVITTKYWQFDGRARRKEYWTFTLINAFITMLMMALFMSINIGIAKVVIENDMQRQIGDTPILVVMLVQGVIMLIYGLYMLIPSLAVTVRRLHDVGFSGALILINFIPFGGVIFLIITLLDSQENTNRYGPNPKTRR